MLATRKGVLTGVPGPLTPGLKGTRVPGGPRGLCREGSEGAGGHAWCSRRVSPPSRTLGVSVSEVSEGAGGHARCYTFAARGVCDRVLTRVYVVIRAGVNGLRVDFRFDATFCGSRRLE